MNRRNFLTGLTLIPAASLFPLMAYAKSDLTIGVFPGTGTADLALDELRTAIMPFSEALAGAVGLEAKLTMFRTIKSVTHSLEKGRLDLYFVPPTVAIDVLDNGYTPLARVKDPITGAVVRLKGATVKTVAMAEKASWPDVMGRYVLKHNKQEVEFLNLKTQEDVVLAMENGYAQAGAIGTKLVKELLAKGTHEVWYPLPATPGFTLMASEHLNESEQNKIGNAAVALSTQVILTMQKVFLSKIAGFVVDKQADYKTLKIAVREAGY